MFINGTTLICENILKFLIDNAMFMHRYFKILNWQPVQHSARVFNTCGYPKTAAVWSRNMSQQCS